MSPLRRRLIDDRRRQAVNGVGDAEQQIATVNAVLDEVVGRNIAVVPTLVNVENFPKFASQGEAKFPRYARHMRSLHASAQAFEPIVQSLLAENITERDLHGGSGGSFGGGRFKSLQDHLIEEEILLHDEINANFAGNLLRNGADIREIPQAIQRF